MTRDGRLNPTAAGALMLLGLLATQTVLGISSEEMRPGAETAGTRGSTTEEALPGRGMGSEEHGSQQQSEPATITYQGREIPNTIEAILDPKHTVLVVHEMLNDFITEGGASDKAGRRFQAGQIIQPIAKLLAAARAKNVRVAYVRWTRHADGSTDSDRNRRGSRGRSGAPSNIEGTWGWQEPEAIQPAPGDWVLPKWRQDAFFSTQLDALMRWNGIKTMVIAGLGAEVGIMPTVMTASEIGYFAVVVEDAIAPSDPARKEEAMNFLRGGAVIKNVDEMVEIWSKASPAARVTEASADPLSSNDAPIIDYGGRQIPNAIEEILNPKHTLLLVHEMINDFIDQGGAFDKAGRRIDADPILKPIAELLANARAKKVRVAFVRWTNYGDNSTRSVPMIQRTLTRSASRRSLGAWAVEHTPGWEMKDEVKPAPGEWVLRKYRPDAFFATPLDTLMRWNGIKTVVIVGIGAEVGVVPTLMTASNLGYFTVAVSDALRPTDPSRMEDAMRYIADHATVKTQREISVIWREASPRPTQ